MLRPVLKLFKKVGFTANGITVLSIVLSISIGVLFWFHPKGHTLWIFSLSLLVRMALNALDGMMAREYNMQSKGGEVLNELGDVIADVALFFPLIKLSMLEPGWLLLFIFLSIINEMSGILAKAIGASRRYDGPMGKSDRALVLGLTCLLLFFIPVTSNALNYIFGGMCILLLVSTAARVKRALNEVTDQH